MRWPLLAHLLAPALALLVDGALNDQVVVRRFVDEHGRSETVQGMAASASSRSTRRTMTVRHVAGTLALAALGVGCAGDRPDAGADLPGNLTTFEQLKDAVDSSATAIRVTALTVDGRAIEEDSVDETVITIYPDGSSSTTSGPNELRIVNGVAYMYLKAGIGLGNVVDETGWYVLPDGAGNSAPRVSDVLFSFLGERVDIERDDASYRVAAPDVAAVTVVADTSRQLTAATVDTGATTWTLDISYLPRGTTLEAPTDPEPLDPNALALATIGG